MKKKLVWGLLICLALNWHIKDKVRQKRAACKQSAAQSKKANASNAVRTS